MIDSEKKAKGSNALALLMSSCSSTSRSACSTSPLHCLPGGRAPDRVGGHLHSFMAQFAGQGGSPCSTAPMEGCKCGGQQRGGLPACCRYSSLLPKKQRQGGLACGVGATRCSCSHGCIAPRDTSPGSGCIRPSNTAHSSHNQAAAKGERALACGTRATRCAHPPAGCCGRRCGGSPSPHTCKGEGIECRVGKNVEKAGERGAGG